MASMSRSSLVQMHMAVHLPGQGTGAGTCLMTGIAGTSAAATARLGFNTFFRRLITSTGTLSSSSDAAEETTATLLPEPGVRASPAKPSQVTPRKEMSSAMKFYLKKKRENDMFIAKERSDFELGKKHLANMMGMTYETMTQADVDKAITYLFPSGLYYQDARPHMKPPEEIFPKQKEAEFSEDGRPFHPFYYCQTPNYHQSLYEIVDKIEDLTLKADRALARNWKPDENKLINTSVYLSSTRWMTKDEMGILLEEKISDPMEDEFITALTRLLENDWSYECKDLIFKFRTNVAQTAATQAAIEPQLDEKGRQFVEYIGQKKTAIARVRAFKPGSGKIRIIHADYPEVESDLRYFFDFYERHVVMYPLQFTKLLGQVDLDVLLEGGGVTSQAQAIRYATSMCIRSFVDQDMHTEMKVAGLLTQDIRVRERKKPGQPAARAKYTWKRR